MIRYYLGSMIKLMTKVDRTKVGLFLVLMLSLGVLFGVIYKRVVDTRSTSKLVTGEDKVENVAVKKVVSIPVGKQVFRFSHGDKVVGPKIQTLEISEMKPELGKNQKITLGIKNETPISKVSLTLFTDSKETNYVLKKKSGTDIEGVWELEWLVDDTYNYRYQIKFDLESATGNYQDKMVFR